MKWFTPYEHINQDRSCPEYTYPRINIDEGDWNRYDISSPVAFPMVVKDGYPYYVHPDIDVTEAVASVNKHGRILEVAGPTETSYELLWTRPLPERPVVTNITTDNWHYCEEEIECNHTKDDLSVDIVADSRSLPIPNDSLGLLMASCIPQLEPSFRDLDNTEYMGLACDLVATVAKGITEGASIDAFDEYAAASPRVGFWLEAVRTVHEEGLVLYRGVVEEELILAAALGFELIAHTAYYDINQFDIQSGAYKEGLSIPHEMLFIKRPTAVKNPLPQLRTPIVTAEYDAA